VEADERQDDDRRLSNDHTLMTIGEAERDACSFAGVRANSSKSESEGILLRSEC
jgi:hypothetical protein